jgi:alkaline phosphatase D
LPLIAAAARMPSAPRKRARLIHLLAAAWLFAALGNAQSGTEQSPESSSIQGPFVGHVDEHEALIWMRTGRAGDFELRVTEPIDQKPVRLTPQVLAKAEHDFCVRWRVADLKANTKYKYSVHSVAVPGKQTAGLIAGPFTFKTSPLDDALGAVRIAFGSCADEDERTGETWNQIGLSQADAVVLMGDTPYIDSTVLDRQRQRYREFASHPPLARVLHNTSWYGTWDDHDFGRDGAHGGLAGKERARQVFMEYHANPSYGDGGEGVYTSFRRGPVETFVVDARWFANTVPSNFANEEPTLLGTAQWAWLEAGLKNSTAPVKVIVSGMIFNDAVRPNKPDYWGAYPAERRALFDVIGRHKVEGVVLVSGDIHRSRVIQHDSKASAGYDIIELISSPMHHRIIDSANAPHPGLIWDAGLKNSFLLLTVDRKQDATSATAQFIDRTGEVGFEFPVPLGG